jgi:hypothetical protein
VLVPAATERVVNDVHRDTTDAGPVGCGVLHLVVFVPGFHKRFLNAAATGNNADSCAAPGVEPLGLAAGHPDADAVFGFVNNNGLHS